jgi:hypothetical protein
MAIPLSELHALADAHEDQKARALDEHVVKSIIYESGDVDPLIERAKPDSGGKTFLMREDPRLRPMPAKPTLADFFRLRFQSTAHLLQSARLAQKNGLPEKVVLACLLHDIAVAGLIRSDHGYWGAQMIAPYVDEEVAWAVRAHQALRFYPDESVGYEYPAAYLRYFGADYVPDPYIDRDYQAARQHKWYMTARLVTMNDLYAFEPGVVVEIDDFADLISRNFRQPEEGLGWDDSPSSHMWRTMIAPTKFL